MDCSLPDSSIHGILHAGALEWVAILCVCVCVYVCVCVCVYYTYILALRGTTAKIHLLIVINSLKMRMMINCSSMSPGQEEMNINKLLEISI